MTVETWIEERVERLAHGLCRSFWHDEGHSFHSRCGSCGSDFMRGSTVEQERKRLTHFTEAAEAFAVATGWSRP